MELLTEQIIRDTIKPFQEEILRDLDWWYGSEEQYTNALNGWDCHILQEEDNEPIEVVIYDLKKGSDGFLETTDNVILKFNL